MSRRSHGRGSRRPIDLPVEEDVRRELRFHLQMRARELQQQQGLTAAQARREARRTFGDYARIARECRHVTSPPPHDRRRPKDMLESFLQDLRFAVRSLRKSPGFVAVALLTLALGIGANTAIFSVVDGVLLSPLPYPEAERIVAVWETRADGNATYVSPPNFLDWQASADSFASLALYPSYAFAGPTTVLGGQMPTRAWIVPVTDGFFATLGVEPGRGRSFTPEEWQPGSAPAVVVSHAFWETVLGGEPDLASIELRAFGAAAPVVGVMPPGFTYPAETDIWWPANAGALGASRTSHGNEVIGRLRPGVSIEAAQAELSAAHDAILARDAEDADHPGVLVRPLHEELYGSAEQPLLLLLGAAGLVLLVACTNLASALLARGADRQRELAIRTSLGADQRRIARQLFSETALLGLVGGAAGIAVGALAVKALAGLAPDSVPRAEALGLDGRVLLFALGVSVLTTLLFGLLPSLRLSRTGVGDALRAGARGNAGDAGGRLWSVLVAVEVALAVVLLVGSGLFVRSFRQVLDNDPGFEPAGVLTVELSLPSDLYPSNPDIAAPVARILDEVAALPGVTAAGVVNNLPLSGVSLNGAFDIDGREPGAGYADYRVASQDYFAAMGIPLIRGRGFTPQDDADSPHVAIINAAAAERFWPGEDPIGRRIGRLTNDSWVYPDASLTIVGIVGNVRHRGLTRDAAAEVYVHYLQRPMRIRSAIVALRTSGRAGDLVAPVRERVAAVDDQIPLAFTTMDARIGSAIADRRFVMAVIGAFSVIALVLAAVGIYGVVSYSTARRTREIGIRMALGAAPRSVRALVIRDSLAVVAAGLAVGVVGALLATRLLEGVLFGVSGAEGLLFGVSGGDPTSFVAAALVLGAAAWLASAVPAWRGARVDPMVTMRED